jgi:hypothetical protein
MEVSGHIHAPADPPPPPFLQSANGTHWIGKCVSPDVGLDRSGRFENEENLLALPDTVWKHDFSVAQLVA